MRTLVARLVTAMATSGAARAQHGAAEASSAAEADSGKAIASPDCTADHPGSRFHLPPSARRTDASSYRCSQP